MAVERERREKGKKEEGEMGNIYPIASNNCCCRENLHYDNEERHCVDGYCSKILCVCDNRICLCHCVRTMHCRDSPLSDNMVLSFPSTKKHL